MAGGPRLTRGQEKAIAALLSEASIKNAAAVAKVSERTLCYWLKQPAFAREYRAARQQVVEHAITVLQRATSVAVATLYKNLRCQKPATEVLAASKILEHAIGSLEIFDLAQRVSELEQLVQAQGAVHDNFGSLPHSQSNNGEHPR
jgi:hypothetical protein